MTVPNGQSPGEQSMVNKSRKWFTANVVRSQITPHSNPYTVRIESASRVIEHSSNVAGTPTATVTIDVATPGIINVPQSAWSSVLENVTSGICSAFVMIPADTAYGRAEDSITEAWKRDFEQIGRDLKRAIGNLHERAGKENR
jgi:hypothetical protein